MRCDAEFLLRRKRQVQLLICEKELGHLGAHQDSDEAWTDSTGSNLLAWRRWGVHHQRIVGVEVLR